MKTRNGKLALSNGPKAMARRAVTISGVAALVMMVVWTAIAAKESRQAPALVQVKVIQAAPKVEEPQGGPVPSDDSEEAGEVAPAIEVPGPSAKPQPVIDATVRWFNGRPAKPARTITMTVTAYSPDARSCGESADGLTATLHSVETNNFHLVAADPKLLPYGSMLSIEGYADGQVVPVLDCGGAIKGHHIDLLFPTHEEARQWGVKQLKVTVWQYIDGKPAENPRKVR